MRGGQIVISPSTLYRKNNFRDLHSDGKLQKEQKKSSRLKNLQSMQQHLAATESEPEVHPSPATRAFSDWSI